MNNQEVENSGRLIILPATFTGGDRYMHKCFQNAMALIREFGTPTFFLTMTANPNWEELKEPRRGYTKYDRPDLLCRVLKENIKI